MALPLDRKIHFTRAEYLALEEVSDVRNEFVNGQIYAMSGAGERHIDIVTSLSSLLYTHFRGGQYKVYQNDMRVLVEQNFYYPDIVVVCGERKFANVSGAATLTNPTVLIEVLSPSTEAYDRGKKSQEYRSLPSLQAYVLVSQERATVECYTRQAEGSWVLTSADNVQSDIHIPPLNLSLSLADIYEQVTFDPY
ncbi:MAG: Uma2 family endonuclease [Anaerolineae bacterium]